MTRLEHLERITARTAQWAAAQNISPDEIYKFVDFSNRKFWKTLAPANPHDHRAKIVLSDGDLLPGNFTLWAGSALYIEATTAGNRVRSFHYVHPEQIGYELTNTIAGATSYHPGFYFANNRFYTLPAAISGVTLWYFDRPVEMFGAGADDTTDDGMPDFIASAVWEDVAQSLRLLSDETPASDEALVERRKEELQQNRMLFDMLTKAMNDPVQQTVKGGVKR